MTKLVKMVRELPAGTKGPTTADVHPDQVSEWIDGGWAVVQETPAPVKKSGSSKKKNPEPDLEDLV